MQSQAHPEANKRDNDPNPAGGTLTPVVSDSSSASAASGVTRDRDHFKEDLAIYPALTNFCTRVGLTGQEANKKIVQDNGLLYRTVETVSEGKPQTAYSALVIPYPTFQRVQDIPMEGVKGSYGQGRN